MLAWHLGLRYLRKRRAAWLAMAAITLTVAVPVVVIGVMEGWIDATRRLVRANESDITCTGERFGFTIPDDSKERQTLAGIPGVAGVAPYVSDFGVIEARGIKGLAAPCRVDAIDWIADQKLGRIADGNLHQAPVTDLRAPPLEAGDRGSGFLTPAWRDQLVLCGIGLVPGVGALPMPPHTTPSPGIVIGREVAYSQGLGVGMRVKIVTSFGKQVGAEISDTFTTGIYEVDRYLALLPLPLGQVLCGMNGKKAGAKPQVTGYRLKAQDAAALQETARSVADRSGLPTMTWMQRRVNEIESLKWQRNLIALVMICIQVITVFIVYAVFSTMVAEKRHDLGVLLGIGAKRRAIAGTFLLAGMVACVFGGILGWAIGWGALCILNPICEYFGIALFPMDLFYSPDAPISFEPLVPLFFMGVMSVIGIFAVAVPAWRAARIDPVAILREAG